MARTNLSSVVSRQIPEFIREDFPTFVAFVEAYYEFLQTQGVDLSSVKDLDKTLDSFVGEFKKELAHNLPSIAGDERFLLAHIKDQYLAKGSKSSYKRGGYWPKWGCLSGGKKSNKYYTRSAKKRNKRKTKKTRKYKRHH